MIIEWPALAFVNRYTFSIYKKHIKNKGYVTVEYYIKPCGRTLEEMCKKGKYIDLYGILDWNFGLYGACKGGNLKTVKLMIKKGANNWNYGLHGACVGGNLDIVNLMIELGANLNWGLYGACMEGNLNMIDVMIKKGANDLNYGLLGACKGGNLNIVNLMINLGANNLNWGLLGACEFKNLKIVDLMIKMGANKCTYCKNSCLKMFYYTQLMKKVLIIVYIVVLHILTV